MESIFVESAVPAVPAGLLLVLPEAEDSLRVGGALEETKCPLRSACCIKEALRQVGQHAPGVILCERDLPDGTWKDLWEVVREHTIAPSFIVTSRLADECLWAEVLNLGAYDVLMKPFEPAEVRRVIQSACRQSERRA